MCVGSPFVLPASTISQGMPDTMKHEVAAMVKQSQSPAPGMPCQLLSMSV